MNRGLLPYKLKAAFPSVIPIQRPLVKLPEILSPHWLAGFTSGEGCFLINIYKSATKLGFAVTLVFQLSQHSRDIELMRSLISYLGCRRYVLRSTINSGDFLISTFSHINEKIILLFKKYEIKGVKADDFSDFCKAAEIIKAKGNLISSGLNQIVTLKNDMNRKRLT